MKIRAGVTLILIGLSLAPHPLFAASGTEAAAFLEIPVGGRPAAMGDAYSAMADDAYATTSNPGGLGFLKSTQLAGQHLAYLESIHYEYLSFVHPLQPGSAIGVSAQYLGSGDIAQTDFQGTTLGQFSTHFGAYSLAYGHTLGDKLSLGVAAKVIDAKIADVGARAYAADVGSMYRVNDKLNLAAVLTNAGTKLTFLNAGGTLPLAFKLGTAWLPNRWWRLSLEGVYQNTGVTSGHAGLEWKPISMVAIRAGYRTDTLKENTAMAGLTTGIGVQMWGQELSYAWVPYGDLGNTQYFSILLKFDGEDEEKRNLIQYQNIRTHRTAFKSDPFETDHALPAKSGAYSPADDVPGMEQLLQLFDEKEKAVVKSLAVDEKSQ